ncbi:hypothetical protein CKA32_004765 [Geitlerinema sp. FC II]|nr:hypothetical protein CKA32_004765 [Geitlerinema sp. FC II]
MEGFRSLKRYMATRSILYFSENTELCRKLSFDYVKSRKQYPKPSKKRIDRIVKIQ